MTTIVAAVGGGNWTTGATWVGGVAPTAADDAQLTVASGNVTIDTGAVARSLDCTGYIGTLTHTAAVTLTLGDATAGAGNVALKLVAGMTYTRVDIGSSFYFISTSATQQTITTAAKSLGVTLINGVGSSYVLGDGLTLGTTSTLTLQAGTFNTGNFACSWGLFAITGAGAKTLTLGSSAIAITGNLFSAVNYSGSNCTFTANTAVMTLSGASAGIVGGNWNGMSAVFTSAVTSASIVNAVTLNNVTVNGSVTKTGVFTMVGGTLTATGTLTVTGNSTVNRISMKSDIVGTARTVTAAVVSLTNVDFQDITAAGAAIPWGGTSMGNALGNSQITFDAPTTQTHTASAGGNWSDASKWTSRVPLPQDTVVVDVNTTGALTADMPRLGADISFAGFLGTFASGLSFVSYGSIVLGSGMTITAINEWLLAGRSAKTITNNGRTFAGAVTLNAPGGTYTITDAFTSSRDSAFALKVSNGTLTISNVNMTFTGPVSGGYFADGGTLNMGTGTWSFAANGVTTFWNVSGAHTVNASTSTIVLTAASTNARTFAGGGKTYGTLTYTVPGSTGSLTITGNNTFGTLNFSDVTNARSLLFTAGTTTTFGVFNVFGTVGKLMTVDSATAATHTLTKPSGTVSSDYLSVKNSLAGGGAYWYAGANSTDAGGNTGWRFTAPSSSDFFLMFGGQ